MMPTVVPFKIAGIVGLVLGLLLAAALWRADHLSGKLDAERAEHKATQAALAEEVAKGMGWKTAYEESVKNAEAHQQAMQACLDRAVAAEKARKERETILQAAPPRSRTEEEKQQVVNDETRARAADRLNRAF